MDPDRCGRLCIRTSEDGGTPSRASVGSEIRLKTGTPPRGRWICGRPPLAPCLDVSIPAHPPVKVRVASISPCRSVHLCTPSPTACCTPASRLPSSSQTRAPSPHTSCLSVSSAPGTTIKTRRYLNNGTATHGIVIQALEAVKSFFLSSSGFVGSVLAAGRRQSRVWRQSAALETTPFLPARESAERRRTTAGPPGGDEAAGPLVDAGRPPAP